MTCSPRPEHRKCWFIAAFLVPVIVQATAQAQVPPEVPEISIAGQIFPTLDEAVAAAAVGDTVVLGPGILTLAAPLDLMAGVSLHGASARTTHLDASGMAAGIRVNPADGGDTSSLTIISGLDLSGANRGIEVTGNGRVVIRNVVLRDNQESGLHVADGALDVTLANATLVRNGTAVVGWGPTRVKNSVITGCGTGLAALRVGTLVSAHNDLFANDLASITGVAGVAYDHVQRGTGDMTYVVSFVDFSQNDFRLTENQAVTDRGDPLDDFTNEPAPNGGRINLGAFGNTEDAEVSAPPLLDKSSGGCAVGPGAPAPTSHAGMIVISALAAAALLVTRSRRRASTAGCRW